MSFILRLLIATASVIITGWLLPGVEVANLLSALLAALVIALLNAFIRPLLVFLTIPITIVTLGIFLLVINALMIELADWIVPGFEVANFWWALLFSLILALVNALFAGIARDSR